MVKKTVMSVTGIRPDFIRMSSIFKKLDLSKKINHILVHTGQHYDKLLSDVFFDELDIRKPDFNLGIGGSKNEHFHQLANLSVSIINLIRSKRIDPDMILFLGDSNSVTSALSLKKEGYKIGHIEAGMRSFDRRMLEEINRVVCDHCSDALFVYNQDYKNHLSSEGIPLNVIYDVGNTIVEVCKPFYNILSKKPKTKDYILVDIHRPENFNHKDRMKYIIDIINEFSLQFNLPARMLKFGRTIKKLKDYQIPLGTIQLVDLMSYKNFLKSQYNSLFMISDSGTAQEEPALLNTPVLVPRDYTERPQSYDNNCSFKISVGNNIQKEVKELKKWLFNIFNNDIDINSDWLGNGKTSFKVVNKLEDEKTYKGW